MISHSKRENHLNLKLLLKSCGILWQFFPTDIDF